MTGGPLGQTRDLSGPEAFAFSDAAGVKSRVAGEANRFHNERH
jgi:hypothetical protein